MLLLRFANDLEEYGKVEAMPVLEGKRMTMYIAPKKTAPKKTVETEDIEETEENSEEKPAIVAPAKKQPKQKERKEYTGPKVEGEDF